MLLRRISHIFIFFLTLTACGQSDSTSTYINQDTRTQSNISRDIFRHPNETLAFFGIQKDHKIVEIWPGAGWYTEILAPYLRNEGLYYAAHFPMGSNTRFFSVMREQFEQKLSASPTLYDRIVTTSFNPPSSVDIAPKGSLDRVLTFRNVHNWMRNQGEQAAFDAFFQALKPGGILGVVEHRAPESFSLTEMVESGYVSESYVKMIAAKSGFQLDASSEINANLKDNKRHPSGVWTLPPTLRLKDKNRDSYLKIGESDRMTLRFIKPKQ